MNISVIGMMGSGKTTVAKILFAKLKNFILVDTDSLIEEREKSSINDIFANNGEAYFRAAETDVLVNILKKDNQIISTGGGIVLKDVNLEQLKQHSVVFFLDADIDTLFERVKNNKDRPLLNNGKIREKIDVILNQRRKKYEQAHYIIDTNNKNPDIIADEIIRKSGLNGNS